MRAGGALDLDPRASPSARAVANTQRRADALAAAEHAVAHGLVQPLGHLRRARGSRAASAASIRVRQASSCARTLQAAASQSGVSARRPRTPRGFRLTGATRRARLSAGDSRGTPTRDRDRRGVRLRSS